MQRMLWRAREVRATLLQCQFFLDHGHRVVPGHLGALNIHDVAAPWVAGLLWSWKCTTMKIGWGFAPNPTGELTTLPWIFLVDYNLSALRFSIVRHW